MATVQRGCELCDGVAALHCAADDAHICWTCDAKVHSANFLVARHTRSVLCDTCGLPTPWRASGANPMPLTGLCANCSQGESQSECTTHDDGTVLDTRRGASRLCPTLVMGRSVSGHESGCSTSNAERCDGKVVEGDTVHRAPRCESASQVSSEDVEGIGVDRGSVQASGVSGVAKLLKMKRLAFYSPGGNPQSKQIMTRALEDVSICVAHRQCECARATSWSSNSRRATHADQDITFEARDCNRSQSQAMGNSNRGTVTFLLSSAKRQRMNGTAQRSPSLPRSQQRGALSTSRLMRMLAKWHWDLHLSSPGTTPLALRMFCIVSRVLALAVLSSAGTRVILAACLRLAAGLDQAQIVVPKASEVAACAGVSTRRLAMTEIHLLELLGWRRFPTWAGVRT